MLGVRVQLKNFVERSDFIVNVDGKEYLVIHRYEDNATNEDNYEVWFVLNRKTGREVRDAKLLSAIKGFCVSILLKM